MENGYDNGKLADKFSGLAVTVGTTSTSTTNNDNLFQVIKAVELAEATIKRQVEENIRLRNELHQKSLQLDRNVCALIHSIIWHRLFYFSLFAANLSASTVEFINQLVSTIRIMAFLKKERVEFTLRDSTTRWWFLRIYMHIYACV